MIERDSIRAAVLEAVAEFNADQPAASAIAAAEETPLYGRAGRLDSLALVNLIVLVEQKLDLSLGLQVTLADERAVSQKQSPFRTVGTLIDYVVQISSNPTG